MTKTGATTVQVDYKRLSKHRPAASRSGAPSGSEKADAERLLTLSMTLTVEDAEVRSIEHVDPAFWTLVVDGEPMEEADRLWTAVGDRKVTGRTRVDLGAKTIHLDTGAS